MPTTNTLFEQQDFRKGNRFSNENIEYHQKYPASQPPTLSKIKPFLEQKNIPSKKTFLVQKYTTQNIEHTTTQKLPYTDRTFSLQRIRS